MATHQLKSKEEGVFPSSTFPFHLKIQKMIGSNNGLPEGKGERLGVGMIGNLSVAHLEFIFRNFL
jgi:hypothetical protein